jgi:hypothetical protein
MDIIRTLVKALVGSGQPHPLDPAEWNPPPTDTRLPPPITRRVLMITHNPILKSRGGITVKDHFRWNDPEKLAQGYIDDVRECSYGYANYVIHDHIVARTYPLKRDGFRYDETSYLKAWSNRSFHQPDGVDYLELVREFDMIGRIERDEIDEVWLFGHPYGGYYESIMAGKGAFWCNAPPLEGTQRCARRFVIMGFNFERGVGEMLENLGHRAESMLYKVFEGTLGDANLFERFTRYQLKYPNRAECGNVHFAPNSIRDYDWGNPTPVLSYCDNWYRFPDLSGAARTVDQREWGGGDIRAHHRWWFKHFPHIEGKANDVSWNWWEYVIDPNF